MQVRWKRGLITATGLSVVAVGTLVPATSAEAASSSCSGERFSTAYMWGDNGKKVAKIRAYEDKPNHWCARLDFMAPYRGGKKWSTKFRIVNKRTGKSDSDNGKFNVYAGPVYGTGQFCDMAIRGQVIINGHVILVNGQAFACD